ncbi:MAG TPA: 6,7-dimethyl-8-ribityllumazine synthase [Erythrobacter sp.]|jgi:6,7-dimethyl-8-ribityllumazine synthase|uniref:6,7-dimethyl-8-ribityllumazine synthase n=2 Tax=Qipengyuania citrea TaxID=225971 RepID=A0A6I4UDR4_9SPHN|nr:6,7-dimethyl-8-ribityllumazine synthase [Qipengyuania citrea]MAC30627.1 6,7-dimethyl-8-ribityllumazine synthase [Erythrobacter sp.]MBN92394.1 6,7-dimethyl-8-ribityllumazine synthase [Erythrobacteraceae bacterium]MCZ4265710.1 6,7-dimethyl-8-ribityllumazine synthase [Erythrobacter sp. G21629-S1]KNH01906.1 6,7-dimethyl-8-ribityllumazine synthase [Qipengyuania citrea LAMA 915]MAQ29934.1 6,7-dimethyl-8-ribityllumazine synthase [Erythrobacter sp.]|tara:strand:- start:733 stop:1155 length:423 start_codon:yes stop_codon:yes gene_type:complete
MARFLIVEARFYDHLNDMLVAGARAALEAAGHDVDVLTVPGALEIPGAIALASESGQYDGYVGIGVVIRGETYHFEIVAGESARGIMALTMDGMAIGNGILTVENEDQALVRADPKQKDKGGEAAQAAMALLKLQERFAG